MAAFSFPASTPVNAAQRDASVCLAWLHRQTEEVQPQADDQKEPLATTFSCLFCNHENSVTVKLDKKLGLGNLSCKVCGQRFQTGINYLSAGVDVYADWVDACDAVAKDNSGDAGRDAGGSRLVGSTEPSGRLAVSADEEDDGGYGEEY
ncbi:hypothetical protein FQN54_007406 [Arachnomyces sp. PD_36]|nr:hypothetical protein FQN54_007406 [Arachnomyces sp. PD_36]